MNCLCLITLILVLISANTHSQQEVKQTRNPDALVGHWEQRGDGRVLLIKKQSISILHKTKSVIYPEPGNSSKLLSDYYPRYMISDNGMNLKVWRWDFGDRCESQFYEEFLRTKELPDSIDSLNSDEQFRDPVSAFNLICEHFDEHFPHFKRRDFDWEDRKQKARLLLNSSDSQESLYQICCDMLEGLGDSHTRLYWGSRQFKSGNAEIIRALDRDFERQSEVKSRGVFRGNWARKMKSSIEAYVDGQISHAANGRFRWAILDGNIGYIENDLITAFTPNGTPRSEELAILEEELDGMLESLKNCRAILLDLSFNQGGYEPAAMMIASRFADRRRMVYSMSTAGLPRRDFYVAPRGAFQFTKPVYILTSNSTVSCGETLTMMLKAFPHIVHVGEPTRGCLSGFLNKPIPNGFHLTLSNQIYESPTGAIPEGKGVQPDINFAVFDPERLELSYPEAIARSLSKISESIALPNRSDRDEINSQSDLQLISE